MRKCKLLLIPLCLILLFSCIPIAGTTAADEDKPFSYGQLDYGDKETPHELTYKDQTAMLADMKKVASSANLELYIDETNLNIAVKNLKTGVINSAYPYNAANDPTCIGDVAKQMQSQIEISYSTISTGQSSTLYSFNDCLDYGQFIINEVDNGVEIIFSLGEDLENQILPSVMTEDSFNNLIKSLNKPKTLDQLGQSIEEVQEYLSGGTFPVYQHLVYDEMDEVERDIYMESYPNLKNINLYVMSGDLNPDMQEEVQNLFSLAGYTAEMKQKDLDDSGYKPSDEDAENITPNFKLTTRYTIDDEHFYAELDANKVVYDEDNYNIEDITMLRYFGASTSQNKGYVFLPDGSGAAISFDDPALERPAVLGGPLYGGDNGTTYPKQPTFTGVYHLPVFGIKVNDSALFGIIEEGDGMSGVYADLGDVVSSYYCAYPIFSVKTKDSVRMEEKAGTGSSSTGFVDRFSTNSYTGNFKVRYNFLSGNDANYVGMANVYREYLKDQGLTSGDTTQNSIQFQMNTLGSVKHDAKFGLIPYTATSVLTSYKDNQTMIDELRKMGVSDFGLQLIGWQKSGLDTMAVNKYRASSKMGGSDDLKELIAYCQKNNIGFYPEADLMYVANEGSFDGFSARSDAIRLINNQYGTHAYLSPTYNEYMSDAYALSPTRYASFLDSFLSSYTKKTTGTSINLARMGMYLNSDFKSSRLTDRQQAMNTIKSMLTDSSKDNQFAFNGANAYVLPYASQLLDVPLESNGQQGETYDVPFLQMVLMNNVSYAAPSINTTSDRQDYLLRCIESQSSPSFNLIYQNADVLKSTTYTEYYNVDFNINKKDFVSYYDYVKTALDGVVGVPMTEHTRLSTNVVRIRYENGTQLYINYGKSDVTVDGHAIKAQSYVKF